MGLVTSSADSGWNAGSSHHGISAGTNCSGRVAKASEQKLDPGPIITAEHAGSLERRQVVKRFVFQGL